MHATSYIQHATVYPSSKRCMDSEYHQSELKHVMRIQMEYFVPIVVITTITKCDLKYICSHLIIENGQKFFSKSII